MESSRLHRLALARGFSLVEMMVVVAIIGTVTTIALLGQGTFNRTLLLTDAAYSIALSLREVQTLGYSSRTAGGVQDAGYGMHLSTSLPGSYILFADTSPAAPGSQVGGACGGHTATTFPEAKPGDCGYTANADALVQTYQLGRGYQISQFCGYQGSNRRCSTDATPLSILNIVYLRSSSDTLFMGYRGTGWVALSSAEIYLRSPEGATKGICISRVGQISIVSDTCPPL